MTHSRAAELLKKVGLKELPDKLITNLGVGKQPLVEIAKALAKKVRLLILDEPTASLNENEQPGAARSAAGIQGAGHDDDHDLAQAQRNYRVADSVTIIRDGSTVHTMDCSDAPINEDVIIRHMVGREMADRYPHREPNIGETIFEIELVVYAEQHADRKFIEMREFQRAPWRGVGYRRTDGCRANRIGDEYLRAQLGEEHRYALLNGKEVDISTVKKRSRTRLPT